MVAWSAPAPGNLPSRWRERLAQLPHRQNHLKPRISRPSIDATQPAPGQKSRQDSHAGANSNQPGSPYARLLPVSRVLRSDPRCAFRQTAQRRWTPWPTN